MSRTRVIFLPMASWIKEEEVKGKGQIEERIDSIYANTLFALN